MLSATPIAVWVQLWLLKYTAMKGPNPVWMFATKRLNQSSPRLARAGVTPAEPALSAGAGIAHFLGSLAGGIAPGGGLPPDPAAEPPDEAPLADPPSSMPHPVA